MANLRIKNSAYKLIHQKGLFLSDKMESSEAQTTNQGVCSHFYEQYDDHCGY
jgi:hypothetical protein